MKSLGHLLLRGSAARLVSNGIGMGVSFMLMPLLLKGLGDRNFGIWALAGAFVGFYGLFDLGINSAVTRFTARAIGRSDGDEFNRFFATSFCMLCGLGAIVLAATLLFPLWLQAIPGIWKALRASGHPYVMLGIGVAGILGLLEIIARILPKNFRIVLRIAGIVPVVVFLLALFLFVRTTQPDCDMLAALVVILGVNVAIQLPARSFAGVIDSHLRYDINSLVQAIESLLRLPLFYYVLHLHFGLLTLALVSALLELGTAMTRAVFAFRLQKDLQLLLCNYDRQSAKVMLEYGANTLVARLADMMRFRATPFLVTLIRSVTLMTPFAIAERLNHVVGDIMTSLMSVLAPVFSRQEGKGEVAVMRETYLFTCRIATYAAVMFGGLMILLGGPFIIRWLGPQYSYVTPIMQVLVLGTIFSSAQMPTVGFLYGTSRNRFYAISNSIHGVLTVLLVSSLVVPLGLKGAAIGITLPTMIIKFFIQPIYACRALNIKPLEFYTRHASPAFLLPLVFLAFVAALTHSFIAPHYTNIMAIAAVSCVAFIPYIYIVGFDAPQRRTLLRSIRPAASITTAA